MNEQPVAMQRVSEKRLLNWLRVVRDCVVSIDRHLGYGHVGEYETILYYRKWSHLPRAKTEMRYTEKRAFSHALARVFGRRPGHEFATQLIDFYNGVC